MIAEGYNGKMEIRGDNVVITRKLFFGRSKGEKSIAIRSITSAQLKKAGFTAGYLQLAFSGSKESKGGLLDAADDENTIMFYRSSQAQFEALRDELDRRRAHPSTSPSPPPAPASAAEQIAEFAKLRDQGILTDEEFTAKKRQLLGL